MENEIEHHTHTQSSFQIQKNAFSAFERNFACHKRLVASQYASWSPVICGVAALLSHFLLYRCTNVSHSYSLVLVKWALRFCLQHASSGKLKMDGVFRWLQFHNSITATLNCELYSILELKEKKFTYCTNRVSILSCWAHQYCSIRSSVMLLHRYTIGNFAVYL